MNKEYDEMTEEELQDRVVMAEYEYESLKDTIHDLYDENKRLNNELKLYKDNHEHLNNLLEQKENIIKEVREYVERYLKLNLEAFDTKCLLEKILEILDKVGDEK